MEPASSPLPGGNKVEARALRSRKVLLNSGLVEPVFPISLNSSLAGADVLTTFPILAIGRNTVTDKRDLRGAAATSKAISWSRLKKHQKVRFGCLLCSERTVRPVRPGRRQSR